MIYGAYMRNIEVMMDKQKDGQTDRISAYRLDLTGENHKECIRSHALRQFDTESNQELPQTIESKLYSSRLRPEHSVIGVCQKGSKSDWNSIHYIETEN